jgi:hypothetical protein
MSSLAAASKTEMTRVPLVKILDNEVAKLYTHLHPFLVLSTYILRFQSTVEDPIRSLYTLLLPLSFLQVAYVVVCLPPSGTTQTASNQKSGTSKAAKQGRSKSASLGGKITVTSSPQHGPICCRIRLLTLPAASTHLPSSRVDLWHANPHHRLDPLRRTFDNTSLPYPPLRCAYFPPLLSTLNIYTRHRYRKVAGYCCSSIAN